jgi:hypothetical protein
MNILVRRLVPQKFQQRCYEPYEQSSGAKDASSTPRSSLFWIPTPILLRRSQIALMACRISFRFARRLLPYVYHHIFSARINDIECHIGAPLCVVCVTDIGIYIPPTNLNVRSCYKQETTRSGMPQRYDLAWNAGHGYSFLGLAFIALRGVLSRSIVFVLWSFTIAGVWSVRCASRMFLSRASSMFEFGSSHRLQCQ